MREPRRKVGRIAHQAQETEPMGMAVEMSESYPSYAAPLVGFRPDKAAQLAAFFAVQSDGMLDKLKLIKLIYMTERKFVGDNHCPMLFDELYSLPHGPICSSTLNGIDGIV